ncbi:MAG: AAA family ATPase [Verrucomicrobiales bacterium]
MQIESLTVQNFKGFAHREFAFGAGFNLLVGDNATGKTSVLEAIAAGLEPFLWGITGSNPSQIRESLVRVRRDEVAGSRRFEKVFPCKVELGLIGGKRRWAQIRGTSIQLADHSQLFRLGEALKKPSREGRGGSSVSCFLPIEPPRKIGGDAALGTAARFFVPLKARDL